MENNVPQKLPSNSVMPTLTLNTVIREQPKADLAKAIASLLEKLARLYQIPNWDQMNTMLLTEWIMDTYPAERSETVFKALTRPQNTGKVWRLTPDTISEWMALEIEIEAKERERLYHNAKQPQETPNEWTSEQIQEWLDTISKAVDFPKGPALSDKEVREEGQDKPKEKKTVYPFTSVEGIAMRHARTEWARECHDLYTGKPNDNWMSFDEWIKL